MLPPMHFNGFRERRLMHLLAPQSETGLTRAGATLAQMRNDLGTGIEFRGDVVTDLQLNAARTVRNGVAAIWHGIQGIIPSVANSFNGQRFSVVERTGAFDGTVNSGRKIINTRGVVGKISAVFAEATDGPIDDAAATIGGAQWVVRPENN